MKNVIFKKVWVILLFANLGIILCLSPHFSPLEDPDSTDYIEASQNLKMGRGLTISTSGIEPVRIDRKPLRLFPAGYPIMIYGLSLLGIDTMTAAILIPRLCFLALSFLLFYVLQFIGGDLFAFFVTAGTIFMEVTIHYSFLAMSDVPFMAMALLSFLLLFKAIGRISPSKGSLCYGLLSGFAAGFALAIRNVGYSIPLAVGIGLTLGVSLQLFSWKSYCRTLIVYGIGFILVYGPFLLRNLIVFHALQPYSMDPSELSLLENVRYYILALEDSFVESLEDYTGLVFVSITAILGTGVIMLFLSKQINLIRNKYPHRLAGAFILILYAIFGSAIVILGRTKYRWIEENINPRHLLQYNWIFLAIIYGVAAFFYRYLPRFMRWKHQILYLGCLIIILAPQWKMISDHHIKYDQVEKLDVCKNLSNICKYLRQLPQETYIVSIPTKWPNLKIFSGMPIRKMHKEISPGELAAKVCPYRPLVVILKLREIEKYTTWQNTMKGAIPEGYQIKDCQPDFMILFHPKM